MNRISAKDVKERGLRSEEGSSRWDGGGTVAPGRPLIESKTFLLGSNSRFQSRDIRGGKNVEDGKHWLSLRG